MQNRACTLLFGRRVLCQDQIFQLSMCSSELHVEPHSDGAEDSHATQSDDRKSTTLEGRVDIGLEVEVVLVILNHPEREISNDKRLDCDQDLDRTRNVSLSRLDMLARRLPPDLESLDLESSFSSFPV